MTVPAEDMISVNHEFVNPTSPVLTNMARQKDEDTGLPCTEEYFDVQYLFSMILCQNLKFVSRQA